MKDQARVPDEKALAAAIATWPKTWEEYRLGEAIAKAIAAYLAAVPREGAELFDAVKQWRAWRLPANYRTLTIDNAEYDLIQAFDRAAALASEAKPAGDPICRNCASQEPGSYVPEECTCGQYPAEAKPVADVAWLELVAELVERLRQAARILAKQPCEVYGLQQTCEAAAAALEASASLASEAKPGDLRG